MSERTEKAILAGGCFWGMQDLIRKRPECCPPGSATPAATCPTPPTATTARTPRRSRSPSIPSKTSYRDLLEFFFQIHDPTTLNRQGNDVGTSYRSAIFYVDDDAAPRRRGHHRRRRSVGALARQGGHRGQPGRPVLGGRARAPGLPGALSQRLHVPLPTPGMGVAPTKRRRRLMSGAKSITAADAGTISLGGDLTVHRLGFGAMRITGDGIWGEPADRDEASAVLRRAVELGVNFIDTADSYGPDVSEKLIAEALHPVPG